jgi:hypothetical protein
VLLATEQFKAFIFVTNEMPTSKFNVGSKHKENSRKHAKTYLFLKTLPIQLKEVKYSIIKK